MTYHKEEYTLPNGNKVYVQYDDHDICQATKECINRDCNRDCANCDIVQDAEDLNNAYDVAINAIERQIPKKPDRWESGHACCCSCKRGIVREDNYCCYCGQIIDWSDKG